MQKILFFKTNFYSENSTKREKRVVFVVLTLFPLSLLISFCIRSRFFCWNLNLMGLMNGFLVFYWEILSLQSFLSSFSLLILELWNIIKLQGHFYSLLVRPAPNLTQFISQRCFKKKKRTLHYTFEDLKFYNSEKKTSN